MLRNTASKVMWVGKATVYLLGVAVILALIFGVASTALGADGQPFLLGKKNVARAVSTLVNQGAGPALSLQVGSNQPPLKANAAAGTATGLSADELDGMNSDQFLQNTGETTFSAFGPWTTTDASVTIQTNSISTYVTMPAGGQAQTFLKLVPSVPSSLYGKSMRLSAVEICYDATDPNAALGEVLLLEQHSTVETASGGIPVLTNTFPPDDNTCQKFSGTPQLLGTNSWAHLRLRVDWSASAEERFFAIQRTTFFLEPSNIPAAAFQ